MDRRRALRFDLSAPALFRWHAGTGAEQEARGVTRDVSFAGVYIECQQEPPRVNEVVEIEVIVLTRTLDADQTLKFVANAEVTRVDDVDQRPGFAAIGEFKVETHYLKRMKTNE